MNFVAHVVVAQQVTDRATTAHLLGAAAPDLVRMARLPVATTGPAGFRAGVAVHHRTDARFHELAWFRSHTRALVAGLDARGVRRGPARGAAHVLTELLLDGALLAGDHDTHGFTEAWAALGRPDAEAVAMVHPDDQGPWVEFLERLTGRLEPTAYADPLYAADRTAGTLGHRPRLAMTGDEQDALRELSVALHPRVTDEADAVLRAVVAAVHP